MESAFFGSVASAILTPLCERLINATIGEYQLVSNVPEEVKKLRSTVSLIKRVLRDAEEKQGKDDAVDSWLRSLKQILLDAEDVLEEHAFNYAAFQARELDSPRLAIDWGAEVRNFFSGNAELPNSHDTAHQIERIRKKLDYLSEQINGLGLLELLGGNSRAENRGPRQFDTDSILADKSYIIGRDDEKEKIIQLLVAPGAGAEQMSNVNKVHVHAIVGMGGVGKTTLAKLVFNDPRVQNHFEPKMWVCVSENFDLKKITKEITECAAKPNERKELFEMSNWDLTKRRLRDLIAEKRFLLVLDDMWEEEEDETKWESLYESINCGGKGSKIIITTRNEKVSARAKASSVLLTSLSREDLWPILERYAFDGCDSNKKMCLESEGRQIVDKVKGSPLAAKTIGRLLNSNLDVKYWISIKESDIWTLPQRQDDIVPILKLSYDHLSGHLKQVFAYCSLFPKDHKFNAGDLVQLWMAQNFIHTTRGLHATESDGSQYLNDLLYKSFFEKDGDGNYLMHDLIHDLAESVSKDDCLRIVGDRSWEISETIRHVLIDTNSFDAAKLKALCKQRNLRTLIFFHGCTFDLNPHLDELFTKLKWLRVLGLSECKIKELPTSIGPLKHLRFLDLERNPITKLPESFCYLHNLQNKEV